MYASLCIKPQTHLEAIFKFLKKISLFFANNSRLQYMFYFDFYCVFVSLRPFQGYKNEIKNHANTALG